MKVTRIKFYQAVSIWNGQKFELMTHLNLDNGTGSSKDKYEVQVLDGIGVKVLTSGDSTIITFNNVAFMTIDETVQEKPKAVKKA